MLDLLIASPRPLSVRALSRAGRLMQISEVAVRVALTRLCAQGKVRQLARGIYAVNLAGGPLLRDVDDWRNRAGQMLPWTDGWIAVHDGGVPRSDKKAWRHHCLALAMRGFANLQPGLSLRPDNLAGGTVALREQLTALGLAPAAQVFRMTELDADQEARACALWNVDGLRRDYRALARELAGSTAGLRREATPAALRESLLLGRKAIRLVLRDPLLPPALMPADARNDLIGAAQHYQAAARAAWAAWLEEVG
jgi:phenylacetic acid degradation operon negative regulatory protein